jgi:hypothetical protein
MFVTPVSRRTLPQAGAWSSTAMQAGAPDHSPVSSLRGSRTVA